MVNSEVISNDEVEDEEERTRAFHIANVKRARQCSNIITKT